MKVERIIVGELQENCYIIIKNKKAIIVDPGAEIAKILKEVNNLEVVGILLTHNHFDHTGALNDLEEKFNLKHNQDIKEFNYEVIKTPGHSLDSLTFYFPDEKIMFTGDFLFQNTIGRTDLPSGSELDMKKSLEKIAKYPNDITIYPGHGGSSLLGREKSNFENYYKFLNK